MYPINKSPTPCKTLTELSVSASLTTSLSDNESIYRGDNDEKDEISRMSGRRKNKKEMKLRKQRQVLIKELKKNLTQLTQQSYQQYPRSYAISLNKSLCKSVVMLCIRRVFQFENIKIFVIFKTKHIRLLLFADTTINMH